MFSLRMVLLPVYTATVDEEVEDISWLLTFGRNMPQSLQLVTHLSPMKELWGHESFSFNAFARFWCAFCGGGSTTLGGET